MFLRFGSAPASSNRRTLQIVRSTLVIAQCRGVSPCSPFAFGSALAPTSSMASTWSGWLFLTASCRGGGGGGGRVGGQSEREGNGRQGSTKIRGVKRRDRPPSERRAGVRGRRLDVQPSMSATLTPRILVPPYMHVRAVLGDRSCSASCCDGRGSAGRPRGCVLCATRCGGPGIVWVCDLVRPRIF